MAWQTALPTPLNKEGKHRGTVEIGLYSKMPRRFFGSGTAALIGSSAALLFLALCEHANRNNGNTFKASDNALASDTGLSPRTIFEARKTLIERELVSCSNEKGQSYVYTLLVYSFEWIRLADRPRPKLKPRALSASRAGQS
jgi:hypothetical protein